jgi:hypothetical protein
LQNAVPDARVLYVSATGATVERTDRNDPLTLPRVKAICSDTKVRRSAGTPPPNARP